MQQAEVIRERTGFQVGHYCGEMGQDFWDARRWQREFESKQVYLNLTTFVMLLEQNRIIFISSIFLLQLLQWHL